MKRFLFSLVVLCAVAASGEVEQSGTPARLETVNGKVLNVFLQGLDDDTLTFQPHKSTRDIPAPVDKIKGLTFLPKYDAETIGQSFIDGDYDFVVSTLGPVMEPYWDYMSISNNLQASFGMLVKAHLRKEDYPKVQSAAEILMASSDPKQLLQGQVCAALVALADTNTISTAEQLRGEVASEAAGLYLQACIERAKGEPAKASWIVCGIIADHGNDLDWMPQAELLSAELYLDQALTNSAANCARQVQSIHRGSNTAADAKKMQVELDAAKTATGEQNALKEE